MQYLIPPYPLINGVSLLPDHLNKLLWHYMPIAPAFTRVKDPATGEMVPQFQLVRFTGEQASGGVLNFDVNLGVDANVLDDVARQLKSMMNLSDKPVLSPALLEGGTVKLILLGRESGDKPPDPADPGPKFVVQMSQPAYPALFGINQASFSVLLTADGVSVLEKAMQGEISPIGIVYTLDYLALRPAYNVTMKVNWERVQKRLHESFSVNTLIFAAQIDKVVDQLIEERVIEIDVDTFVPEGDDSSSIIGRRDQAVNEIRDMITDAFFAPSIDPSKEGKDGWDKVAGFHSRMTRMGAMGPGTDALFSRNKLDYTRIDRKSLNVRINERTTVKRSIYPQGHLSGLFRVLKNEGIDLSRFVIDANLDNPFFAKRRIRAISRADYATDNIASVNLSVQYGADKRNVVLEPQKETGEIVWSSILESGAMKRDVTSSYTVTFKGADRLDRPVSVKSPERVETGDVIEITPRELYSLAPIKVMVLKSTFPWDRITHVEVALRYKDEANKLQSAETLILDKDNREKTWTLFLFDPRHTGYQYKVIYHAAQGKDIELAWADADSEQISIANPFAARHTVSVSVATAIWTEVDRVFVDVAYEDADNDIFESKGFKFASGDADQTFVVDLADPQNRVVTFVVTFFYKDGRTIEVPESATRRQFITVSPGMQGHRIVTVRPEPIDFARKAVKEITVDLRYAAGVEAWEDQFTFDSADDRQYFEFNYTDPTKTRYEHKETYLFANGLSRETDWTASDEKTLVIKVG